jgi:hypothetical protein
MQTLLVQVIPAAQPMSWKHTRHWSAWQTGALCGQSLFAWQTRHAPSAQTFPGWVEQSELARHCTQEDVIVSHSGVSPEQPVLLVQPARHRNSCGSQIGAAAPQSELLRHATHCPDESRHLGADAGQSLFWPHCTHWLVVESQIGVPPWQLLADSQPTHWPVPEEVLQVGAFWGHAVDDVHAAWHW